MLFHIKIQIEGLRIYFSENPTGIFRFVIIPIKIPQKTNFHSWKFCKIACHPLEIPRSKTKTHGNSAWVFLGHSWKFHFLFNYPLKYPYDLFQYPLEISWPQSVSILFGMAHYQSSTSSWERFRVSGCFLHISKCSECWLR